MNYSYLNDDDDDDIINCPEVTKCVSQTGKGEINCDKNQVTFIPCKINDDNPNICKNLNTTFYCGSLQEKSLKFSRCKINSSLYGYCNEPGPSPTPPSPPPPSPPPPSPTPPSPPPPSPTPPSPTPPSPTPPSPTPPSPPPPSPTPPPPSSSSGKIILYIFIIIALLVLLGLSIFFIIKLKIFK